MAKRNPSGLLMMAALGGGLYWASKQPGGVKGTFDRLSGKVKELQESPRPLDTLKGQFNSWQNERNTARMIDSPSSEPTPII